MALAQKHPSHIEFGAPNDAEVNKEAEYTDEVVKEANDAHNNINDGLPDFQFTAVNLKGEELFCQMVQFRQLMITRNQHRISAHLSVSPRGIVHRSLQ